MQPSRRIARGFCVEAEQELLGCDGAACRELAGGKVDGGAQVVLDAVAGEREAGVLDALRDLVHVHEEVGQALVDGMRAKNFLVEHVPCVAASEVAAELIVLRDEQLEDARDVAFLRQPRVGVALRGQCRHAAQRAAQTLWWANFGTLGFPPRSQSCGLWLKAAGEHSLLGRRSLLSQFLLAHEQIQDHQASG